MNRYLPTSIQNKTPKKSILKQLQIAVGGWGGGAGVGGGGGTQSLKVLINKQKTPVYLKFYNY